MTKVSWIISAVSDIGLQRRENQDSYYISPDEKVLVVADGMGGAANGAEASQAAIHAVEEAWKKQAPDTADAESTKAWLQTAVVGANRSIMRLTHTSTSDPAQRPGSTIVVAVQSDDGVMRIAHVGDSRAYLVRNGQARSVTEDHSVVMDMVKRGQLNEEQAFTNVYRNLLTRCLGHDADVEIEQTEVEVHAGDWALLCSDGLNGVMRDGEIADVVKASESPAQACNVLVENVLSRKAPDNVTIIALHYGAN